jgi:type I restriction enzyme R subunit
MPQAFTESTVEDAAIVWLEPITWPVAHGPDIAPDMLAAERRNYVEVVLAQQLRDALARLNPALPADAMEDAFRKLTRSQAPDLIQRNRSLHPLLVNGVTAEYRAPEGELRGAQARVIDFDDPAENDWLAVNQFGVTENKHNRRPDVVLFVNGLQLQTYRAEAELQEVWQ